MWTRNNRDWVERNGVLVPHTMAPRVLNEILDAIMAAQPAAEAWFTKSLARDPITPATSQMQSYIGMCDGIRQPTRALPITNDTLWTMHMRCPPVAAVISAICNLVARFCQRPQSETDIGFRVRLADRSRQPTSDERDEIRRLEDMFLSCGFEDSADWRVDISLEQFCRAIVRDSLIYDAACFEIIPGLNRRRYPVVAIHPVDAKDIYLTEPTLYHPKRSGVRGIRYVMMEQHTVVAEYTSDELAYIVRNPSTNRSRQGYGCPELEQLVTVVSSFLFALNYNEQYFTTSSVPPGVLSVVGSFQPETLEKFRREWQVMMHGPANAWKTPIFATKDGTGITYTKFRESNKDMEFHQFMAFLITIVCSLYNAHPELIGMQSWAPQRPALNEPSPKARIEASQNRCIKPVLTILARQFTRILRRMYPDGKYEFVFVNIDPTDEERELRMRMQRLQAGITIPSQEIAEMDRESHPYADVPINPNHFQVWLSQQQEEQPSTPNMNGEPAHSVAPQIAENDAPEPFDFVSDEPEPTQTENDESTGLAKSLNRVIEVHIE